MRARPLIGVTITALALGAGCTVKPVPTTTYEPVRTPTTRPAPGPGPVKYAFDTFPDCQEIQQKAPNLPPALKAEPQRGSDRFSLSCTFTTQKNDGPMITFRVELYENVRERSGAELAKSGFSSSPQGTEKDTGVSIGSEARWADPGNGPSCRLEVLDENAYLLTGYNSRKQGSDPRGEECRSEARTIATRIFAAVQPQ